VDEVKIDGVAFTDYHLRAGHVIYRNDGKAWPASQNFGLADTEDGTFSITYTYGVAPPPTVLRAAKELAVQFWLLDTESAYCQLPTGTRSVSRQGMSIDVDKALESSNRTLQTAWAAYPMGSGIPADAWFESDWELVIVSA
jgi:hypothetical protein